MEREQYLGRKEHFEKDAHGANKNLRRNVEAALNFDGESGIVMRREAIVDLSKTSPILAEQGLPEDANIITKATHIRKLVKGGRHGHSLGMDEIVALPEHYSNPRSVYIDKESFLVVTDMKAKNKRGDASPVVVVLTPVYGGKKHTFMASAYPMEEEMHQHFANLKRQGKLIYTKKDEPKGKSEDDSSKSITTSHHPAALINKYSPKTENVN